MTDHILRIKPLEWTRNKETGADEVETPFAKYEVFNRTLVITLPNKQVITDNYRSPDRARWAAYEHHVQQTVTALKKGNEDA
jgi:hypothetical protein